MSPAPVRLFVGSSSEALDVARNFQAELEATGTCEVVRWDHIFAPSGFALESLLQAANEVDFAVLIASPDDVVISREKTSASARDNVFLEFGLFAGALGRERTYLLATADVKMPTDVLGLTRLPYNERSDGNLRAAVNGAVLKVEQSVLRWGPRRRSAPGADGPREAAMMRDREIALICSNARAQGWIVKTNSETTLRLQSPRGRTFTLQKRTATGTRGDLRPFAAHLRAAGLRVNSSVRMPADDSPLA